MKNSSLLLLSLLFLSGCKSSDEANVKPEFSNTQFLTADSVILTEPFTISSWKIDNDKLIIFDRTKDNALLSIFQLPDLEPLYTYGKLGHAQGEFIAPMWLNVAEPNTCGLYDMANKRMFVYDILIDTLANRNDYNMGSEKYPLQPYTIIQQYNDSLYLYRSDDPKETVIELRNPARPNSVKTFQSSIKRPAGVSYTPYDYTIHQLKDKVIFAFKYIDRMEFYNKLGFQLDPVFIFGPNQGQEKDTKNYDNFIAYYTDMTDDGELIYAAYQQDNKSFIEVWDLSGTPLRKYELDKQITKIAIDNRTGLMYAYDPRRENNVIYTYLIK